MAGRPPKAAGVHDLPPVSVIIPARHAGPTLPAALESVTTQDYGGALEVIVADGAATAALRDLVRRCFPQVRVVPNPERGIPTGLNHALRAARHGIIVRCDARAVLPPGYVARAVRTLRRTGAANVGGQQNPAGATLFERAVALATTTWLGAGKARYRLGGAEGPVETVYLGVFRRDALDAVGGFDETLLRNEDYELNWRLRERGEMVWFDPGLVVDYRPRGSLRALARQYFDYGRWKRVVLQRHPRSWRLRQLAAPLLLLALAASGALVAALHLWGLGLAGSVGGFAGLFAGVGFLAFGYAFLVRGYGRGVAAAAVAVLGVAAILLVIRFVDPDRIPSTALDNRIARYVVNVHVQRPSVQSRLVAWETGVEGFAERPVLGWGPDNFETVFGRFASGYAATAKPHDHAHGKLVEVAATTGVTGLAAYLALWSSTFLIVLTAARRTDRREQALTLFAGAALFAGWVQS